jgi:hypothetical protein
VNQNLTNIHHGIEWVRVSDVWHAYGAHCQSLRIATTITETCVAVRAPHQNGCHYCLRWAARKLHRAWAK